MIPGRTPTSQVMGLASPESNDREAMRHRIQFLEGELARCQEQLREMNVLRAQSERLAREVENLRRLVSPQPAPQPAAAPWELAPPPERPPPERPALRELPRGHTPMASSPAPILTPDQGLDFGAISALSPEELDGLPYGMITLDAAGRVIHYNDTESRLVGLPKERVIGRNFFQDIAPCTRLREFEGRFRELVLDPARVRVKTFDFVFRFPRGDQHVTVVMTPAKVRGRFHLALLRRSIDG
jgi:photoactive yellow protein